MTNVHIVTAMVFLVVTKGFESWIVKKAECQRIDTFKLQCLRRLLRVPWTAKRSNQSILKEINSEYSLEGLCWAEAWIFCSSDANNKLIGKLPEDGKDWGQKEKTVSEDEMAGLHLWCNVHELGHTLGDGERQGGLTCCSPWDCRVRTYWVAEQQLTFTTALCLTPQTVHNYFILLC